MHKSSLRWLLLSFSILMIIVIIGCQPSSSPPIQDTQPTQPLPNTSSPQTQKQPEPAEESASPGYLGQDLALLENSNGKIVTLNPVQLDMVEAYKMRYLSDGLEVVGFILKPEGNEGKYPVLIYNKGYTPESNILDRSDLINLSTYVYRGFVVLASLYRGNDGGEGKDEFGGDDVNDVLNLIPLAESLPFTIPDEIVMLGFSRGGMMTYLAISKTDKIKAAVVNSGLVDCIQLYYEREQYMKQVLIDHIGGDPVQKETEYKLRSANYWPEKINTPILILHGDADRAVNVSQAQELADKLKTLGKTYELVIYPDADHGLLTDYVNVYIRTLNWFTKYLPDFQVKTPFLGIRGITIDDEIANRLNLPVEIGVYVIEVIADGPAEKAGIKPGSLNKQGQLSTGGDIILKIDNTQVTGMQDLLSYLYTKKPGDVVSLLIYRINEEITIPIKLEGLPEPTPTIENK